MLLASYSQKIDLLPSHTAHLRENFTCIHPLLTILSFNSILYYLLKITYENIKLAPNSKMNEKLTTQDLSSTGDNLLKVL